MLAFPSLLLLIGALFILLARRRHERAWWLIAMGAALLAWLYTLGLLRSIPSVVEISVWRPEELFASRVELVLDSQGWQLAYAAMTLLLSVLITAIARRGEVTAGGRAMMLLYTALAIPAMLSGNMLTVATTWALLDLTAFAFLISISRPGDSAAGLMNRLAIDAAGVILVVGASIAQIEAGTEAQSPLSVVLLSLAVLLRLGLFPPHFALPALPGVRRGLGTLLRLLPAAVALSALARSFEAGVPGQALLWLRLGGVLGVVIGGLRWVSEPEAVGGRRFLVLGLSGLGVLAATLGGASPGGVVAATGSLVLLVGAVVSLNEIHHRAHRAVGAVAALLTLGLPLTPGATLMVALLGGLARPQERWIALVGLFGMLLLGVGTLRRILGPQTPWASGESLVKILYGAGVLLPILAGVGLGLRAGVDIRGPALAVSAGMTGVAAAVALTSRRLAGRRIERWRRWLGYLDLTPLYGAIWLVIRECLRMVRTAGDLFEGEGAMLWTYVVLLIVSLAVLRKTP